MIPRVLDLFSGYTISEAGEVRNSRGRVVAQQISKAGYFRVELWENGKGTKHSVHRLVASTFIPNPENKPQVNHLDGSKANNHVSNLEWSTQSENQIHAYTNGLQVGYRKSCPLSDSHKGALCGSRWKAETHIYEIEGLRFENLYEASAHFGVSRQTILNRCKSKRRPLWSKRIERR